MEKTKIILLQGLLCFISVTQLSAAQRELLQAGGSARRLDGANSPNLFSSSRKTQGDDSLSSSALKKETRTHGTQTDPKTLSEDVFALLAKAGTTIHSTYDFSFFYNWGSLQDAVTAAAVASVGLRVLTDLPINNTKIEEFLIFTGVLEGVVASYAMTREDSRYSKFLPISVLCGLSTCAAFLQKKDFTRSQSPWGKAFSLFTIGSTCGPLVYQGLQWLKKPSTNTDS
jgi:hypothetical protein